MDDVDYLVEYNAMDDFAYHRKRMGPMVEWHIGGASWEQNEMLGMLQPSYPAEIQIWLVSGYFRKHVWKRKGSNTNRRDGVARFSGRTTIASSKT